MGGGGVFLNQKYIFWDIRLTLSLSKHDRVHSLCAAEGSGGSSYITAETMQELLGVCLVTDLSGQKVATRGGIKVKRA